jgi:uncharacterized protein
VALTLTAGLTGERAAVAAVVSSGGRPMANGSVQQKFSEALAALVEQVKQDRSILAAVVCGSLSHDTVWARSDIDLVLVTIDDRKAPAGERALDADGVNVHAILTPRAEFRKVVEGSVHNWFMYALLAKGRLLYTHDESIADLFARLGQIGGRDTRIHMLGAATLAVACIYKARKWFITRKDLEYSALYILYAATPVAELEVLGARLIVDREVISQAIKLKPALFRVIYRDLLNTKKTARAVEAALDTVDRYLAERAPELFGPVLDHLREAGEARSATDLEDHFGRNFGIERVTGACEYLADLGLVGKASLPVQITRRSNVSVQELAFFYQRPAPPVSPRKPAPLSPRKRPAAALSPRKPRATSVSAPKPATVAGRGAASISPGRSAARAAPREGKGATPVKRSAAPRSGRHGR